MLLKAFRSFGSSDSFCDIGPGGGATFETARFLDLKMKMFAFEPDEFSKNRYVIWVLKFSKKYFIRNRS